jgi:hypothetical protein
MGRVKQLFHEMWEEKLLADEQRSTSSSGSRNDTDQALSDLADYEQYRKEFEEWLDAYEKSFADKDGRLP